MSNLQTGEVMTKVTWLEPGLDLGSSDSKFASFHFSVCVAVLDFREQKSLQTLFNKWRFPGGLRESLKQPNVGKILRFKKRKWQRSSPLSLYFYFLKPHSLLFHSLLYKDVCFFCPLTSACTGLWVTEMPVLTPMTWQVQEPTTDRLSLPVFHRTHSLKKQECGWPRQSRYSQREGCGRIKGIPKTPFKDSLTHILKSELFGL